MVSTGESPSEGAKTKNRSLTKPSGKHIGETLSEIFDPKLKHLRGLRRNKESHSPVESVVSSQGVNKGEVSP